MPQIQSRDHDHWPKDEEVQRPSCQTGIYEEDQVEQEGIAAKEQYATWIKMHRSLNQSD